MSKNHYRDSASEKDKKAFASYLSENEELVVATGFGSTYLRSIFIVAMLWPGIIPLIIVLGLFYLLSLNLFFGFGLGAVSMILIAFLRTYHTYHANRYILTNRRVIIKKGVFAVQISSALYDKITHLEVIQSFFDKVLMHHGTIIVNTAGMNSDEIVLTFVEHPIELKNLLERLINREREHFGQRSGPVVTVEGELV